MIGLNSKINELYRVGATGAKTLNRLGLKTISDLLFYFPFRYDDFTNTLPISDLKAGLQTNVTGTIELIQNKRSARRRMYLTEALISDNSDTIKVLWFNQPFLARNLKVGDTVSLSGRVSEKNGQLVFISPLYEKALTTDLVHTKGLVPNYHLTSQISQKQLRALVKQIIHLAPEVPEWLPQEIRERLKLLPLGEALTAIHFPKNLEEASQAEKRLVFTELFLRQLKSQLIKRQVKSRRAPQIKFQKEATQKFVSSLPFKLTTAQKKSAWEILQDLDKTSPMSRLLEGDVGSGKTLVAVMAMLNTALNKKQAVLMVPTEILAEQHFHSISKTLKDFNLNIVLLTHSHKVSKDKQELITADIIIGTQALIQKGVSFRDLALVIIDEQHRFGVRQRQKLLDFNNLADYENGLTPHFLSMTATPIPRSLALAIYGDLDLSIIDELPANRQKITTKLITENQRQAAYNFIRDQIKQGHQAFVVCPLIDESDKLGTKSVKKEYEKLAKEVFPEFTVGLLHGKLKAKEKEDVMAKFAANKLPIIVSTSVIEVGVDVPNATIMMIEGAERFGLATLHQFRGRVGRSDFQSYCFLFPSKEELDNPKTITRLEAMTKYSDGFSLAKIDLRLRGAGELYGLGQSGFPELKIASLFNYENIKQASQEAMNLVASDPDLASHELLKAKLGEWEESIHLE